MNRVNLQAALQNANVRAFLALIRAGEGTSDEAGFRRLFGGELFAGFADHPRRTITKGGYTSTAAGAGQFLSRTWDGLVRQYGFPDFSPACQEEGMVALIAGRGALADVQAGRIEQAVEKCNREWASLPGSPYGQPTRTMKQALATYTAAGGAFDPTDELPLVQTEQVATTDRPATHPAQPQPETPMLPLIPLIAALGESLISAFTPLAAEKIQKEIGRHTDNPELAAQVTSAIVEAAQAATGLSDPIEAVAEAKKTPLMMAQIEQTALDRLAQIAPLLDKLETFDRNRFADEEGSRDAAAARAAKDDMKDAMGQWLIIGALGAMLLLLLAVLTIMIVETWKTGAASVQSWTMLSSIGGTTTMIVVSIYAYRFGASRSDAANQATIAQIAKS